MFSAELYYLKCEKSYVKRYKRVRSHFWTYPLDGIISTTMIRKTLSVVFVVLLLALGVLPVAAQDQSSVGAGGIGGRPAYPRDDNERSKSIFIHTVEAGDAVDDGVKVINNSEESKTIAVYATDSVRSSDGAFACAQMVEPKNEVGSWIALEKEEVTLEPSESEIIPFTIAVPTNADVGEHNGCIVMQEADISNTVDSGIGLSFRSAIRVALLVPGTITKQLSIESLDVLQDSGSVILTPSVQNMGNVSLDVDMQSSLERLWGGSVSVRGGEYPVLRDQTSSWNFKHDAPFWGGWYKTSVTANYDSNVVSFLGEEETTVSNLRLQGKTIFVVPAILAFIIYLGALVVVLTVVVFIIIQVRNKRLIAKTWATFTVEKDDDIKQLAHQHHTSWKKIAKANGIKPPYTLHEGQKIKLPKLDE